LPNPDNAWLDFKFSDLSRLCEAHAREFIDRSAKGDNGRTAAIRKKRSKHRCLRSDYPSKELCDTCRSRIATVRIILPDHHTLRNEPFTLCYSCSERQLTVFFLFGYVIVDTCFQCL
jgi:hypothetical protein